MLIGQVMSRVYLCAASFRSLGGVAPLRCTRREILLTQVEAGDLDEAQVDE